MTTSTVATLPRSIYIEPTSRCNEFCQQCPRTFLSREEDRDLPFDDFRRIVDQFPVLDRVVLHGLGEPLLNKDLPKMVRYLKDRGTYVLFNSNGIALTEARGQALIDAGLDEYRLSMDGSTRETYAHVRGVDAFDKIWRNVSAFVKLQQAQDASKPAVSLWFTAMRENLPELPGLVEKAYENGIREIYLQRLVYFEQGLAASKQALFHRALPEELAIIRRTQELCQERGIRFKAAGAASPVESVVRDFGERPWSGCQRPYTLTYITSSGNVLSCCFAPFGHRSAKEYREERVLGNVFQESIEQIWHGERYNQFRNAFESDHPARHCAQCGVNWSY
ncbi:radical SAM protein [Dictyobacter aurantiacus]|uniref:Coenzyme PQQ synthesis protein E n=1 Tax=Dictyobacter aurantiacus TaxID=1936993 RepID=A0A401ZFP0_9CHLR|nr:radical SAM protein [Dictyobacter aurantiacus]GCE05687.1 coenzyme PQQ synthesis protein E [Dictyobacter aurantiacus]